MVVCIVVSAGAESSVENMESLAEFQQPLSKKNESTGQIRALPYYTIGTYTGGTVGFHRSRIRIKEQLHLDFLNFSFKAPLSTSYHLM